MNKTTFWILSLTWGLPLSIAGLIISLVMIISGKKPKKYGYCIYFETGHNWGGLELGPVFLKDKSENNDICNHEFGHGIQNCFFGPLMPFVICIPSALRYWYRKLNKKNIKTDYDRIWFEHQATKLGRRYLQKMK